MVVAAAAAAEVAAATKPKSHRDMPANTIKLAETQHKEDDNSHKGPLKDIGT